MPACSLFDRNDSHGNTYYESNYEKWQENNASEYTIVIDRQCYCTGANYPAKVIVKNDTVFQVLDAESNEPVLEDSLGSPELTYSDVYPTIDQLFTLVKEAINRNADQLDVTYNESFGYPSNIYIDYSTNIADEEIGYTISAYRPTFYPLLTVPAL